MLSNTYIHTHMLLLVSRLCYEIMTDFTRSNGTLPNQFEQEQILQTRHLLGRVKISFDPEQIPLVISMI